MLIGSQTWEFRSKPAIIGAATVVGPEEGEGPLSSTFDFVYDNLEIDEKTWEKAERKLLEHASALALVHAGIDREDLSFFIGGDLMNQIITATFAARTIAAPYLGVFGACSTSMESLALAAFLADAGGARYVMAGTASHNCTVEKQFRYPTEYGSQKPATAQYTITGAGCAIVSKEGSGPRITHATIGRIQDLGIKDPFNMGAAMAPAAADTLVSHFRDTGRGPEDYDLIVTGDLASVGHAIVKDLLGKDGVSMDKTEFNDCGLMIYDREKQTYVNAGGSGCGCSAVVTYGHILRKIKNRELGRVLIVATGALLSPLSYQQGESIPCIAHAVALEQEDNDK
ncbi:stage V sporulation protein AD [Paenibacillus sp.]|jgi:stage V sporulation protein AD|uniref:stage V sporulation protein AD n=1 Tax=Paenibacillus sp. TaxID=58172 RepID=UPI0015B28F0C|nr:stage V sporulation protein AD [Paenibacillus sp.]MDU2240774.1 stage V sporulation protein AD [Paenibacillus sp.]